MFARYRSDDNGAGDQDVDALALSADREGLEIDNCRLDAASS
jgi:hypothetical protein